MDNSIPMQGEFGGFSLVDRQEYKIAYSYDGWVVLESEVNKLCSEGWKPIGGVTLWGDTLLQPMIRTIREVVEHGPQS